MKILVGLSGGLDSTYAAYKLKNEGHTVEGAVLIMHDYTEIDAARQSADSLGIPLHTVDCREQFDKIVVKNFVDEYLSARTPNPCVICNRDVKFRCLLDYALENGFDMIATGHYARVRKNSDSDSVWYALERAEDTVKDQTYMLWRLSQDELSRLILPLSSETKREIRSAAKEIGLSSADREESQEICFIPSGDYAEFIEERSYPSPAGNFIDAEGNVIGEHKGIIRYTVGQRKGLGIAMGKRVFVKEINKNDNTVVISEEDTYSEVLNVSDMIFSGIREPGIGEVLKLNVKVRYRSPEVKCELRYLGFGKAEVRLEQKQRAVTPGQSAVFYTGNLLACGGFIN